jgi:acyl-coenzyme A synthetase/AMP-(fatty) acid ligase
MVEADKMVYSSKSNIAKTVSTDIWIKKEKRLPLFWTTDPTEKALHITYNELHQRVL